MCLCVKYIYFSYLQFFNCSIEQYPVWLFCSAFVFSLTVFLTMLFLLLILIPEFPWPSQIRLSPQIVKSSPKPLLGGVSAWAVFPNSLIIPRGYITLHRGGYSLIFLQKKVITANRWPGSFLYIIETSKKFFCEKRNLLPFTVSSLGMLDAVCFTTISGLKI